MKAHMKPLFKNKPKSLRKINFINNLYSTTFSKKNILTTTTTSSSSITITNCDNIAYIRIHL